MSGNPKCPACGWTRKDHGMERQEPLCTGRAGCVLAVETGRPGWVRGVAPENEDDPDFMRRQPYTGSRPAAGTEGGATDGMGTRTVEWPGESEITRLRAEVEQLPKERDEALADRHARDIAVVKAALEAAAGSAKTIILAHPIGFGLRGMSAVVSDRDGAIADKVETSIRALDPEAVLKMMEEERDGI